MTRSSGVVAQDAYASKLAQQDFPYTLAVGAAFVRGMREVGYRNTATALCELVDNAEQAEATQVHIIFGYDKGSKKPSRLAIIDDGHGMSPTMLRAAVLWGGTHREDDRAGFGRFGYGLPSSCVSQGRAFNVYSKRKQQSWFKVGVDLDDIANGLFTTEAGHIVVPPPERAELPDFVEAYLESRGDWGRLRQGTVIVIEKLDRIDRKTTSALHDLLVTHFGVTYHKIIGRCRIFVDGKSVDPVDPLFLTPGHRFYDLDEDRAQSFEPLDIAIKPSGERPGGHIRIRFAYLPYTFQSIDKSRKGRSSANLNGRFHVMRDYNGMIICRNGRVIECKSSTPWTRFQNNDRHVRVELDFDAALDDEFRINTSKQRVDLSERIWDILRQNGLERMITVLRREYAADKVNVQASHDEDLDVATMSERILEQVRRKETHVVEGMERGIRSAPPSSDRAQGRLELQDELYKLGQRSNPGGGLFDIETIAGKRVLWLNTEHSWFKTLYARDETSFHTRRALELMLFTLGNRLIDTRDPEARRILFYEIGEWSKSLGRVLDEFDAHFADPDPMLAEPVAAIPAQ